HGEQDQRAAHRRRARLGQMRLRSVVAHRLADLVRGELADHVRPQDQRDRERGKTGEHRAQRDVVEDVEQTYFARQPLGEFEQHQWPPLSRPPSAATTRSMRMKREPLTSSVVPLTDAERAALISSSMVAKWRAALPKPATACAVCSASGYNAQTPRS